MTRSSGITKILWIGGWRTGMRYKRPLTLHLDCHTYQHFVHQSFVIARPQDTWWFDSIRRRSDWGTANSADSVTPHSQHVCTHVGYCVILNYDAKTLVNIYRISRPTRLTRPGLSGWVEITSSRWTPYWKREMIPWDFHASAFHMHNGPCDSVPISAPLSMKNMLFQTWGKPGSKKKFIVNVGDITSFYIATPHEALHQGREREK